MRTSDVDFQFFVVPFKLHMVILVSVGYVAMVIFASYFRKSGNTIKINKLMFSCIDTYQTEHSKE